jgi:hypothetical protein
MQIGGTHQFIGKPLDIRAVINGAISGLVPLCIIAIISFAEK